MTIVHLYANLWRRYVAYGLMACKSLIERGKVPPRSIVFTVSDNLMGTHEVALLVELGVQVRMSPVRYIQKFTVLDEVFKETGASEIVQIDADTVLLDERPLFDLIEELLYNGPNLVAHSALGDTCDVWPLRNKLFIPAFQPQHIQGRMRLDAMLRGLIGLPLLEFEAETRKWVRGGFMIVSRRLRETPAWRAMVALSWISSCDESIIQWLRLRPGLGLVFSCIQESYFPQHFEPKILNLEKGTGIAHYAADSYREREPYRSIIEAKLYREFGISIPSDLPNRAKRALGGESRGGVPFGGSI